MSEQGRYFTGIIYGDEPVIKRLCSLDEISHFCYIYHNNDKWLTCDNLPDGVSVGDLKKPHWHLMVYTTEKTSASSVYKLFNDLEQVCPSVEIVKSPAGAKKYQRHIDDESVKLGKAQYAADDQVSDDIDFWDRDTKAGRPKVPREEWSDEFLDLIVTQKHLKRSDIYNYSKKFGRDFTFNYNKVVLCACDILGCLPSEIFNTPLERAAHNARISKLEYETNILEKYRDYAINQITDGVVDTVLDRFNDNFKKEFYK